MALSENEVNKKHSRTWTKCNDDAKSSYFRGMFLSAHGGEFVKNGKYWEWIKTESPIIQEPPVKQEETIIFDFVIGEEMEKDKPKKYHVFINEENKYFKVCTMKLFLDTYSLNKNNIYEVISGKRNHCKGFKYIKTVEP